MKLNNRFIYGILSIILAVIIAFIAIPAVTSKTSSTTEIVRITAPITRGTQITAEQVELVEVGGFNIPDSVAKKTADVVGTYAAADLFAGDYILPEKVSSTPLSSDLTLNEIPDGMVAISISTQTLSTALSDKLQADDIIRLYHYDDENVLEPVTDIPELRFIKVLSVTDPDGLNIDYTTPPAEDEERQRTATITVLATPEQALLLTRYENEGMLHVALISRGNKELATELLERQSNILITLYGDGLDSEENTLESSMDTSMQIEPAVSASPESETEPETATEETKEE